ncbi:MAG: triose-phosphate isomerase [Solirubrobacterales bacterium]
MPERMPYLAANWKMHKTGGEATEFVEALVSEFGGNAVPLGVEVVLCPPFTALANLEPDKDQVGFRLAAQNMHEEAEGAFTGEVSAPMLLELGVDGVILGHSERRQYFGESDEALARKVPAALGAGLEPILCVGENEAQRDSEETEGILTRQIAADLADVPEERLGEVVIAYEPIWAIGTGRTATPEQAQEACALIRGLIESRSSEAAAAIRILYGGSVKPANAAELIALPDVDGALVGGASLDPNDFAAIVEAAR